MKKLITGAKGLILAMALALTVSCAPKQRVVIVSTNDIHSAIDAFPSLATLVDSLRAANPDRFLLVDAGDRWTGSPYVDYATEPGRPIIELMNKLGYNIATFGNHEWDNGVALLAERAEQIGFRLVLANADMLSSPMPRVPAYEIMEVGGLKIGFLGLVTTADNGHPVGKPASFEGITFSDPLATAQRYKGLRDSVDLYIGLTHIGLSEDSLLAVRCPELDLIIGGHSHDVIPVGTKINNSIVTQSGKSLKYAGVTTITYRGGKILEIENHLVELATIAPSPQFQTMVDDYKSNPFFAVVVGQAADEMNKIGLMNLYSDIMRVGSGAKFSFYNIGGMRTPSLAAGDITRGDIFSAEPFRNMPRTFLMTLDEIKQLIVNKFNSKGKESHTLDLYPSGMTYKIITDDQGEATDVFFEFQGQGAGGQKYVVSLSDYVAMSYNFAQKDGGISLGKLITDMAQDYIKGASPIGADNVNRVEIE